MLVGKGAAICSATKIAEAGVEDALGKQIANNQPQCLLQLLRLFQAAYVLEQKEVDETLLFTWLWSSQYRNMYSFVDHTLESCWKNWRERMTGKCYGWVLLVGVRAEVKYQGVLSSSQKN